MTIRVCLSILPKTTTEALRFIEKAEEYKADFIEIRLDKLRDYNGLADMTSHGRIPLIAANKSLRNGGKFRGSEAERQGTLLEAAKDGFEYVDLDLSTLGLKSLVKKMRQTVVKLIVSFHDFGGTPTPANMSAILEEEKAFGADVCKIVTTARRVEDNLVILDFLSKTAAKTRIVSFCMGELGKPSRFLSPLFGAFFTFVSIDPKSTTAPGQLSVEEMKRLYSLLELM